MLLTIVAAIFVFGLLVLVHELGHFMTAKLTGMRVDEFAIGFGPKIFSKKYGETTYSLRAIPLGGFNDIAGMNPDDNNAGERGYCNRPIYQRMIVIVAGSAMNLILPIFIFFGIFLFNGVSTPSTEPILGTVVEGKAAYEAGLRSGDRVISINGKEIATWQNFVEIVQEAGGENLEIRYSRDGVENTANVVPVYDNSAKRAVVGVMSKANTTYPGFFESLKLAFERTGYIIYAMVAALAQIIMTLSGAELAGPIGVVQMTGEVAQMGFVPLLNFAAFLSLNLGIINLLPVPALDGGHFMMLLIEAIKGSPVSPKALVYAQYVGITLLIMLMVFATKNDIVRFLAGG